MNPFTSTKTPVLFDAAKCRAIRARYAEAERVEFIGKYKRELAEAEALLGEPRMAWLAEQIRH